MSVVVVSEGLRTAAKVKEVNNGQRVKGRSPEIQTAGKPLEHRMSARCWALGGPGGGASTKVKEVLTKTRLLVAAGGRRLTLCEG